MSISIFDLFSIGIGPSSSHTVGPMRAAKQFLLAAESDGVLESVNRVKAELYGSLALTGKGHGTDIAVVLGLLGFWPEEVNPDSVPKTMESIRNSAKIQLLNHREVDFSLDSDLVFHYDQTLMRHANGMRFTLYSKNDEILKTHVYYSVGGGFVLDDAGFEKDKLVLDEHKLPYPFASAEQMLAHCERENKSIAEIMLANEKSWRSETEVKAGILEIWEVMKSCIERGCCQSGMLPGGLKVHRRASSLYKKLISQADNPHHKRDEMNWINLYALAVNEENAAGGRVVTAPTNGAAGIIPAVANYYMNFTENPTKDGIVTLLLTAAAIGILFKEGASISAAEVGCQGEVGVACSMAAAGLAAALGGNVAQVENAAEMGMEHNLGLTCDPVGGLVQIPCIERNAMGSVQAINTAKLALMEDGHHHVSLDAVIATMRETGKDMQTKYKETAQGGLAVNLPAC